MLWKTFFFNHRYKIDQKIVFGRYDERYNIDLLQKWDTILISGVLFVYLS